MARLSWGRGAIGLRFSNDSEYYETLGYLANYTRHSIKIYTHSNDESGAWAGQGKLEIPKHQQLGHLPRALQRSFSLSGDHRLSVSDYVENLIKNHGFSSHRDPTGNRYTFYRFPPNKSSVAATVPLAFMADFESGYNAR